MALGPRDEIFLLDNIERNCTGPGPCDQTGELRVARYRSDGQLDPGFSPGVAVVARSADISVDRKGRVVVAAAVNDGKVKVFRFSPGGTLDPAFGTDGEVSLAGTGELSLSDLVIGPRDEIILSTGMRSSFSWPSDLEAVVFRLTSSGAPDPGFGGFPGVSAFDSPEADVAGTLAVVRKEIVTAVTTDVPCCGLPKRRLVRFAWNGRVVGPVEVPGVEDGYTSLGPVLPRARGGAWAFSSARTNATITAYGRKWHRDLRVGRRGSVHIRNFSLRFSATAATERSGRVVVAGISKHRLPEGYDVFRVAVLRLLPSGRIDRSFAGGSRRVLLRLPDEETKQARNVALGIQSDGGIVVLASSYYPCVRSCTGHPSYFLLRLRGGSAHSKRQ
ncbi:MAG TPA: hypothetical protein VFN89_08980 [Solirubrobacterales bacterium]|nr:hypothetical protein [Solirubrobacterales bacterium]